MSEINLIMSSTVDTSDTQSTTPSGSSGSSRLAAARANRVKKASNSQLTQPWEGLNQNVALREAMSILPPNYHFEIPKCIWKILSLKCRTVALQFPEGLALYACMISDIMRRFTGVRIILMSDVTYGACCIDDYTAEKCGADLLIHYGHSCLVPITNTSVRSLYVFVEIDFNTQHLFDTITTNFTNPKAHLCILGTVQFLRAVREMHDKCGAVYEKISVPQVKPLSPGETLGCTSPILPEGTEAFIFLADGRFHMESVMIRNPHIPAYRYDPYNKTMTREVYDIQLMHNIRKQQIQQAKQGKVYGVILGTLGHQGNTAILQRLKDMLAKKGKICIIFLMAEIQPLKLKLITHVDVWIQIACPRLSIDWGLEYDKIILTPYEAMVALGETDWKEVYPMDFYSNEKQPWSNYA